MRPSALLQSDALDLGIDLMCYLAGMDAEADALREITQDKGMVFPAVIIGGG